MHLALRASETAEWEPLNENYGIFFAAGVPIQAATLPSRAERASRRRISSPIRSMRRIRPTDAVAYGAVMRGSTSR